MNYTETMVLGSTRTLIPHLRAFTELFSSSGQRLTQFGKFRLEISDQFRVIFTSSHNSRHGQVKFVWFNRSQAAAEHRDLLVEYPPGLSTESRFIRVLFFCRE